MNDLILGLILASVLAVAACLLACWAASLAYRSAWDAGRFAEMLKEIDREERADAEDALLRLVARAAERSARTEVVE